MTVTCDETAIRLTGACGIEEVEVLADYLDKYPSLPVDLSAASAIHTALWQALMVFRPKLTGVPASAFIAISVLPGLMAYINEQQMV